MGVKKQFKMLKENWLIVLLLILLVFIVLPFILSVIGINSVSNSFESATQPGNYQAMDSGYAKASYSNSYYPGSEESFSPETENRLITKSSNLETKVKSKEYKNAKQYVKSIIQNSDAIILNENEYTQKRNDIEYKRINFKLKIDTEKYPNLLNLLKEVGELERFNETKEDITGETKDLEIELKTEQKRLKRYQEMYSNAQEMEDKIDLNDRIFNQERKIEYLEKRLDSKQNQVDYSTINYTLQEKQSGYAKIAFVKFSQLINTLVNSLNALLSLIFIILPFALAIWLIVVIIRKSRRKHKRR